MALIRRPVRRGQVLRAGLVTATLVVGAPAANGLFTRTLNAGTTSTGSFKLDSATGNSVTVTSTPNGGSGKLTITG